MDFVEKGIVMARIVICYICKKEIESRSPFAHETLTNHLKKEHREVHA
jgi:hypothetical protein